MKRIIIGICFVTIFMAIQPATATKDARKESVEMGKSMSQIILKNRSHYSGYVLLTENGIAITTNRGTFLLKGKELQNLVGKNVLVTGVMREGMIFAVKIDVVSS